MLPTFFINQTVKEEKKLLVEYSQSSQSSNLFNTIAYNLTQSQANSLVQLCHASNELLIKHALLFPEQLPKHIKTLSPKDQIKYLLSNATPITEILIPSLAFTLQQLAIDIICQYPEQYGNLLLEGYSINELREKTGLDHPSVLQALADHILKCDIFVERYTSVSSFPVKEYYFSHCPMIKNINIHNKDKKYLSNDASQGVMS